MKRQVLNRRQFLKVSGAVAVTAASAASSPFQVARAAIPLPVEVLENTVPVTINGLKAGVRVLLMNAITEDIYYQGDVEDDDVPIVVQVPKSDSHPIIFRARKRGWLPFQMDGLINDGEHGLDVYATLLRDNMYT